MLEKKRYVFKCRNCGDTYTLTRQLREGEQPRFIVECPYCGTEAVADLAPYRSEATLQMKGEGNTDSKTFTYQLPEVIPTQPIE